MSVAAATSFRQNSGKIPAKFRQNSGKFSVDSVYFFDSIRTPSAPPFSAMPASQNPPLAAADQRGRALRDLRVSVTDRCNFRCGYCMPRDVFGREHRFLPKSQLLSYREIETLVRIFVSLGVRKVRLTGGEPLLRHDLEALVARLARLDNLDDLAMTTNASVLTQQRAQALRSAGIRRMNISLDAMAPKILQRINPVGAPIADILRGIDHALSAGFASVKINMVVQKGVNVDEIIPMARYFRGSGAILRFIEFMDVGNHNRWSLAQVFTAREIIAMLEAEYPLEALDANYRGEVARRWRYRDGAGEVGIISSITQPFCGACARARLSAVGELYTCLFATAGADLRKPLRTGATAAEIAAQISAIWHNRRDQYSVERWRGAPAMPTGAQKVEMSYIGG